MFLCKSASLIHDWIWHAWLVVLSLNSSLQNVIMTIMSYSIINHINTTGTIVCLIFESVIPNILAVVYITHSKYLFPHKLYFLDDKNNCAQPFNDKSQCLEQHAVQSNFASFTYLFWVYNTTHLVSLLMARLIKDCITFSWTPPDK